MKRTIMGRLLVNEALPEDMRDDARVLDKKGINDLLRQLAQKHPDKYVEVSKKLSDIGRTVATEFGGYTFGLKHLRASEVAKKNRVEIQAKMKAILGNERLTPQQRKDMIVKMVGGYQQKQIDDIYTEAVKANNPLALQVVSGSRGNKMNLGSLLGGDMLYSDHRDQVIPLPVLSSYSDGLKPMEYWAATYGARRGTMATKFATQDAGFLSKQLNQVAHRLMVVGDEDDRDIPNRGLPVDTADGDNEGALLAQDVGPYKRNTVLTPKILAHLKGDGHDRILVRSPLVGGSPDGGVYARDVGVRERGVLPGRGEQVGLTAAQALSEPLSQGQLSAKHSGGVAGQEKAVGGFAYINQLIQVPKKFKGGAAHAEHDGTVSNIEPAPAGGNYVWVGDKRHYVPGDVELKVKKGDTVEAGDVLSEGFPNPAVVTEHKGIGEGKRYFVNAYVQASRDAGMKVNRRNVELLARGLINHVRLTEEFGDHVPDDVVPYSTMEHLYEPRPDHELTTPDRAVGKFLERPVLHYSIGTKVRPSVLKELGHFGVKEVAVHRDPPPFRGNMVRGMYSLQHDPDWMTRMYGSGLKDSVQDATHHGAVSDELGTSFVPALSRAVDFGQIGSVRQPEKGTPLPPEGQPFGDPRAKTTPAPAVAPKPSVQPPKKTGMFSGLFKMSAEELAAEAAALVKAAQTGSTPHVDTTTPGNTGSSTNPLPTGTRPPGVPAAPQHPLGTPPTPLPPPTPGMAGQPGTPAGLSAQAPRVPQPPAPPGTPTTPALPGQVHPGRYQPGMVGDNPWANWNAPRPAAPPPNPAAMGRGLFGQFDDPAMAARFVAGGGDPSQPGSGFGGQFGEVTRFGTLLDTRAVGALTSGREYLGGDPGGEGHDDLIGGDPDGVVGAQPSQPAPSQGSSSMLSDIPRQMFGPEGLATAAGASVAYRGARALAGAPAAGGVLGGVMKPLSRAAGPLAFAVEAREAAQMPQAAALARFNASVRGQTDTRLPFNLGTVGGDTGAGYLFNQVMEPGRNLAGLAAGAHAAVGERHEAASGALAADAREAYMLQRRLASPPAGHTPEMLARDRARLEELNRTYGAGPGVVAGPGYNFQQEVGRHARRDREQQDTTAAEARSREYAQQAAARERQIAESRQQAEAAAAAARQTLDQQIAGNNATSQTNFHSAVVGRMGGFGQSLRTLAALQSPANDATPASGRALLRDVYTALPQVSRPEEVQFLETVVAGGQGPDHQHTPEERFILDAVRRRLGELRAAPVAGR